MFLISQVTDLVSLSTVCNVSALTSGIEKDSDTRGVRIDIVNHRSSRGL